MEEGDTPDPAPAPARSQEPVSQAPWITMFPKAVRGDDMLSWGATPEEMVGTVRGAMKQNAEMKAALATYQQGVPKEADDYTFTIPDEIKDAVKPEDLKGYQQVAKKLGLSVSAAQELVNFENTRILAARKAWVQAQEAKKAALIEELRTEYKDKTDAVLEDAFRVVTALGGQELHDALKNEMGNNPLLIRAFIKLAPQFNERGVIGRGQAQPGGGAAAGNEVDLSKVYPKSYGRMTGKVPS